LETIEVRAEKPLIQKDLAQTAFSVGEMKLEKLPISSFRDVMILQPGTTLEGNVRGGKTDEVLFLVDGLPVQDVVAGGLGTSLPKSAITGLTINTGGFEAEYGNAMSGVVNVVTKGGRNEHSFLARYEGDSWIPDRWNKEQDRANEAEITAGGPIFRDKLYYFSANNIIATDTRWWQDFDHFFLSPVSQEFTGLAKLEYVFSPAIRLTTQGIYSIREWHDYEFSWRFNLGGLPPRARYSYRAAAILSHTLSKSSFYTLTGSIYYLRNRIGEGSKSSLQVESYQYDFFLRYIVNGQRNWWADSKQTVYTAKGDFTQILASTHLVKIGAELNQYDILSDLVKYEPQTTYFGKPILSAPLLNYSNRYSYQPRSGSVYLQDKIELIRDGSIVTIGARWDFLDPTAERPIVEYVPISANEYQQVLKGKQKARFKQQISPRISAAIPAGPSTFFFMNFGHYFQFPLFDYLYSGINPSQLRGGTRSILTGNPDLEPERVVAWELGFKYGINPNLVASFTYFKKSFKNQIDSKTLVPFDSKSAGDYGFASYVNNAEANASGFELVLSRERDEKLTGTLSYSLMTTEGVSQDASQGLEYAQWGFPTPSMAFPLSWDQRHTIKADGEFKMSGDVLLNVVFLYNSARPYTYFPTRDGFTPIDSAITFIPNNKRMGDVIIVNAKISKSLVLGDQGQYRVSVYADMRNLLNKKN
ncbi:MAG TPA: TonB-dependent receptor, partial [Bacteroidota bacterium]|nr:TonB-dependent receptor [Bacteroidota bacterium]